MKIKILEKKPKKILTYRIYEHKVDVRGKTRGRNWISWSMWFESKRLWECEDMMKVITAKGIYRTARLRADHSIEWLVEFTIK